MEKKGALSKLLLSFYFFSAIISASIYFVSSGGLIFGTVSEFINKTNIAVSSFFLFSLYVSMFFPIFFFFLFSEHLFFNSSPFLYRFNKMISIMISIMISGFFSIISFLDGSLFYSMGLHITDKAAVETVKSGNLFKLLQVEPDKIYKLIPVAFLFFAFSAFLFYFCWKIRQKTVEKTRMFAVSGILMLLVFVAGLIFINWGGGIFPESLKSDLPGYDLFYSGDHENNLRDIELNYTITKKDFPKLNNRKNILFIVVESLNMFVMDPELTPSINRFFNEKGTIYSENHYSSALYTEYSIFTLLYGVNNQYYRPFSKFKQISYPMRLLQKSGYQTIGATASPLKSWRKHAKFLSGKNFKKFKEFDGTESSDRNLVEFVKKTYSTLDHEKPAFFFLFLNSTHHPYHFEKEFKKYIPYKSKDFSFLTKISDENTRNEIINRYKNAVLNVDHIFNEILDIFKDEIEKGTLAVIFTADHGEEFWEYGKLGHGKYLNNARARVPLMMSLPGEKKKTVSLSGHVSVFPTIIDYLQPQNYGSIQKFMEGNSLLREIPENNYIVTGSSAFPFHNNIVQLAGKAGKIIARKSGNSLTVESSFSVIKLKTLDDKDLTEKQINDVNSYLSDYSSNMTKFIKYKKKK